MTQAVKNVIGDLFGYGRCPVTGDTYWRTQLVSVPYSRNSGILISSRALSEKPKEVIASIVFKRGRGSFTKDREYTLEEIAQQIPEGCWTVPKK